MNPCPTLRAVIKHSPVDTILGVDEVHLILSVISKEI